MNVSRSQGRMVENNKQKIYQSLAEQVRILLTTDNTLEVWFHYVHPSNIKQTPTQVVLIPIPASALITDIQFTQIFPTEQLYHVNICVLGNIIKSWGIQAREINSNVIM